MLVQVALRHKGDTRLSARLDGISEASYRLQVYMLWHVYGMYQ